MPHRTDPTLYCGFCGRSHHEVALMIAGLTTAICSDCIPLVGEVLAASLPSSVAARDVPAGHRWVFDNHRTMAQVMACDDVGRGP